MVSSVKLAELWQKIGYRVVVVCMGKGRGQKILVEQVSPMLEIHRIADWFLPDPWNYGIAFGFSGYVCRLQKKIQPDIVVVNKLLFWSSLSAIALRMRGISVIQLTDALVGMTWWPRGAIPKICAAIYAWTLGWLELLCASKVVFFHPQPESLLRRLRIAKKSTVIPTGVDTAVFRIQDVRSRKNSSVVVTYVGRLESVKGVDDFLAAAVPLAEKNSAVKIQVAGWYKEGHALVEQYRRKVHFMGLQTDVAEILADTDVFVLPSHSEGLSNALMEAMVSGCACVASDVGGNRFLVQNGVSGFLFPAGDREALRSHIQRLIDDPAKRRSLGEAAQKRIVEMFSWDTVGKQYDALFSAYA
jgi:glycosyltransferase involved in cell wall biosynthesis